MKSPVIFLLLCLPAAASGQNPCLEYLKSTARGFELLHDSIPIQDATQFDLFASGERHFLPENEEWHAAIFKQLNSSLGIQYYTRRKVVCEKPL